MSIQSSAAGGLYDKGFQQQLLAHLFHCPKLMQDASQVLRPDDFGVPVIRLVYEALRDDLLVYKELPSIPALENTIIRVINNNEGKYTSAVSPEEYEFIPPLLAYLQNPGPLSEVRFRAELPKYIKWIRSARVYAAHRIAMSRGIGPEVMTQQLLDIDKEIDAAFELEKAQRSYIEETGIANTRADVTPHVSTGLHELDTYLDGGLALGDLGMVTGCPGVGKSMTLINWAAAANSVGLQALFISLELDTREVKARWTAMSGCIPGMMVKLPLTEWTPKEAQRYRVLKRVEEASSRIYTHDATGKYFTTTNVEQAIKTWKENVRQITGEDEWCQLVCVDWLDWLHLPGETKDTREDLRTTSMLEELRYIARRQKVAMWTATQGNKEADGRAVLAKRHTAQGYHKNDPIDIGIGLGVDPGDPTSFHNRRAGQEIVQQLGTSNQEPVVAKQVILTLNKNRHGPEGVFKAYMADTLRLYADEADYEVHRQWAANAETPESLVRMRELEGTRP